jgi:hypothetical protein
MKKRFVAIAVLSLASTAAFATVIHVPGQYPTIQAGIEAAVDGDTVLVADGLYTGTGNKNLDFGGRLIVLQSENGPEDCIIDCEGSGSGFYFHCTETNAAVVRGFTVCNGNSTMGGGFNINQSSPIVENCIIYNCNNSGVSYGGGIYLSSSLGIIVNCTLYDNYAYNGGGIYINNSAPTINSCILYDNIAHNS